MARIKRIPGVDPDYYRRQAEALLRKHRQVILLNDKELEAIEEYRRRLQHQDLQGGAPARNPHGPDPLRPR